MIISLRVSVPFCSFRNPYSRQYWATERFPPPSTVYGFLLSLVGEEYRATYRGTRLAIAVVQRPRTSVVLRTVWRVKSDDPLGTGNNKRPDYQQVLSGLVFGVWVHHDPAGLAQKLESAAKSPEKIQRYGGLSLGESRDLVNDIHFNPRWEGEGTWLVRDCKGPLSLPVWVDHVGSKGTHWVQFAEQTLPLEEPDNENLWIPICPP